MNGINQVLVPTVIPMIYPIQAVPNVNITNASMQSPRSNNTDNKDNNEGEERKSDTTTTTSNSTIPNGNSSNTTPTPGINTTPTATTPAAIIATTPTTPGLITPSTLYNPYLNPYLVGMNMNGFNMNMIGGFGLNQMTEPQGDIHYQINQMQSTPQWQGERDIPQGPYYVLKVACVATGYGPDDRSVAHIALIDWNLQKKANVFVKPEQKIVSYIEPLTSLTAETLDEYGFPLEKAINIIKSELPTNAVLIGQNISMDLEWLGFKQGEDFREFIDLRDIWRSWHSYYKAYTHYSLTHQAKCILNYGNSDKQKHSASIDAITTMKLFQYYLWCRWYNMQTFHNKINLLKNTIQEPAFAKKYPMFEGVQMQNNRKYKGVPYITATPKKMNENSNNDDANSNQNDDNNDNDNDENNKDKTPKVMISKKNILNNENNEAVKAE